jgi:hypothetical protein
VLLAWTICCVWYSSLLSIIDLTVQVVVLRSPSSSCFWRSQFWNCLLQWQVSYLRYGLMVRHIIDRKSPVYGLTMESLREGDASFSLTIMGLERTSMQSIFHLEVRSFFYLLEHYCIQAYIFSCIIILEGETLW